MSSMLEDCLKNLSIHEFQTKYKLDVDEIFDLAQTFFNEKAEKAFHLSFDDRIDLSALICLKKYGKFDRSKITVPGFLDIIGQRRNARWEALSNMKPNDAQIEFINRIYHLCPLFVSYLEAYLRSKGSITDHYSKETDVSCSTEHISPIVNGNQSCFTLENEAEIRAALNAQTESQFQSYAALHHPNDSVKRLELIAQLQERHFREYVAYIRRHYLLVRQPNPESKTNATVILASDDPGIQDSMNCSDSQPILNGSSPPGTAVHCTNQTLNSTSSSDAVNVPCTSNIGIVPDHAVHASEIKCSKTDPYTSTSLVVHAPILWTRGEVKEFKQCLAEDEESIIRISSGEVYSVRVQTHPSGTSIVWEFATDDYDIGFGLFFEWAEPISDPDIIQNSHILPVNADGSHSEATMSANEEQSNILVDEIIPVTRRNSQTEVCCGSHLYPGPGTYVFKFDNSFSLWRSKTLYYRVCYTY
ncbi:unnamed protein product [Heterobilharzia americana]|nr:unnamed protein product [Heterobilharzia americana]